MSKPLIKASRSDHLETNISFWDRVTVERTKRLLKHSKPLIDWASFIKTDQDIRKASKSVRSFYKRQNEQITRYLMIDYILDSHVPQEIIKIYHQRENNKPTKAVNARDIVSERLKNKPSLQEVDGEVPDLERQPLLFEARTEQEENKIIKEAIIVNFALNVLLLVVKIGVAYYSSSISIFASLVDSLLDFISTVVIFIATYFANYSHWKQKYKYPVLKSRKRFEPLSVTFFGTVMIMAFTQIAIEAVGRLLGNKSHEIVHLSFLSLITMIITIFTKFIAYLWCKSLSSSTAVDALAQDSMTDVTFNTFAILFPVVGSYLKLWWLDALGALSISIYVCFEWLSTIFSHMRRLSGESANIFIINQLTYMAYRFSDLICHVKALHVYHAGDMLICEVDVVLDESTSLRDGHDTGESLQIAIESLNDPPIERAFVHLDYSHAEPGGHV